MKMSSRDMVSFMILWEGEKERERERKRERKRKRDGEKRKHREDSFCMTQKRKTGFSLRSPLPKRAAHAGHGTDNLSLSLKSARGDRGGWGERE